MLKALEAAAVDHERHWSIDREMAATTAELLHQLILVQLRVNGAKNLGKPLHIDRPWDKVKRDTKVGFRRFAGMLGVGSG